MLGAYIVRFPWLQRIIFSRKHWEKRLLGTEKNQHWKNCAPSAGLLAAHGLENKHQQCPGYCHARLKPWSSRLDVSNKKLAKTLASPQSHARTNRDKTSKQNEVEILLTDRAHHKEKQVARKSQSNHRKYLDSVRPQTIQFQSCNRRRSGSNPIQFCRKLLIKIL